MKYSYASPGEIEVDGVRIFIDYGDNDSKFRNLRRSDAHYMAKSVGYLESYSRLVEDPSIGLAEGANILELGIFSGGSAVFLDRYLKPRKLVCIDYMPESAPSLDRYQAEVGGSRIKAYYGVDQSDGERLKGIIAAEFDGPIDLVIDDASHYYRQTRASFEAIFPYMREGGLFVLEDWSWAHNAGAEAPDHFAAQEPALTNLVTRFVMAHGADITTIRRIGFDVGLMWLQKGVRALDPNNFSLSAFERPRGRDLPLF